MLHSRVAASKQVALWFRSTVEGENSCRGWNSTHTHTHVQSDKRGHLTRPAQSSHPDQVHWGLQRLQRQEVRHKGRTAPPVVKFWVLCCCGPKSGGHKLLQIPAQALDANTDATYRLFDDRRWHLDSIFIFWTQQQRSAFGE